MISDNPNFTVQRNNTAISLKENAVIFFVFDLSNKTSFDQLEEQLETVRVNLKNINQIHILLANQTDSGRMEVDIDNAKEFASNQGIELHEVSPKDESFGTLIKSLGERIYSHIEKSEAPIKDGYGIQKTAMNDDKPKRGNREVKLSVQNVSQ